MVKYKTIKEELPKYDTPVLVLLSGGKTLLVTSRVDYDGVDYWDLSTCEITLSNNDKWIYQHDLIQFLFN
jgi:hypothetical protein